MGLSFAILVLLIGLNPDEKQNLNLHSLPIGGSPRAAVKLSVASAFGFTMKDLTGLQFGSLTVTGLAGRAKHRNRPLWNCVCDCGVLCVVVDDNLKYGHTKSCGCRKVIVTSIVKTTHGASRGKARTREYRAWLSMHDRCLCPTNIGWEHYGGRGITICAQWLNSFENFLADMGTCPPGLTLDRINNNGNYEPGNCRWATRTQQNRNYSRNHLLTFQGRTQTMIEWCEERGLKMHTVSHRIRNGWTTEEALAL